MRFSQGREYILCVFHELYDTIRSQWDKGTTTKANWFLKNTHRIGGKEMTRKHSADVVGKSKVNLTMSELLLPDADSAAEIALTLGLDYCVQKMGLAGRSAAMDSLRKGEGNARGYCHYSIGKHVAESLGALDENVKAVYIADYDATPEDICFGQEAQAPLIHLIVWVERKTSALHSLVEALDRALVERYTEEIGPSQLAHLLDIQLVDDAEVENRSGYGALLTSLNNRPIKLWER
jgi:hypothetical protein